VIPEFVTRFTDPLVNATARIPHLFHSVRKQGTLFHFWAMAAIALFVIVSNTLAKRASASISIALMNPDEIVTSVLAIAPYTAVLEESADQLTVSLTGDSFIGSNIPAALPQEFTHTVAKGESLASIAQAYDVYVSDLLALNEIKPEDAARVSIGQVVRVPAEAGQQDLTWLQLANEARRKAEEQARLARLATSGPSTIFTRAAQGGNVQVLGSQARGSNTYPFGWCTYWVASKRYIPPRWGNAKNWLNSARVAGWATGSEPRAGAVVVTTDNSFYGHVAYVEAVTDSSIVISEMNYVRWGVANTRTIPRNSGIIRGYIY
jgi:surface antigen